MLSYHTNQFWSTWITYDIQWNANTWYECRMLWIGCIFMSGDMIEYEVNEWMWYHIPCFIDVIVSSPAGSCQYEGCNTASIYQGWCSYHYTHRLQAMNAFHEVSYHLMIMWACPIMVVTVILHPLSQHVCELDHDIPIMCITGEGSTHAWSIIILIII